MPSSPTFPASPPQGVALSVVSHGHGAMVQRLLDSLVQCSVTEVTRVVLTLNLPEPFPVAPETGWPFVLEVRQNASPKGFGANHNAALTRGEEPYFCVVNPDVEFHAGNPFPALLNALWSARAGLAYPIQVDGEGVPQDSERELPTPWSLLKRYLMRHQESTVEWVNGAFWVIKRDAWQSVSGLDDRYFMYCEDVDFCLRLQLVGWRMVRAPVSVKHAGQRESHRRWKYGLWHVMALCRLWRSPVFWRARHVLRGGTGLSIGVDQ